MCWNSPGTYTGIITVIYFQSHSKFNKIRIYHIYIYINLINFTDDDVFYIFVDCVCKVINIIFFKCTSSKVDY